MKTSLYTVVGVYSRGLDTLGRRADDLRHPVCAVGHDPSVLVLPLAVRGTGTGPPAWR